MTRPTRPAGIALAITVMTGLVGTTLVGNACASALANADPVARGITIINGAVRQTQRVEPGALIQKLCLDGCIVRIDDDPKRDFVLEGRERVTIEDGLLYYDGEVAAEVTTNNGAPRR